MSLTVNEKIADGNVYILEMKGFIDTSTASVLEDELKKLFLERKTKVVIDLAGTEFVSSSGWGAIVGYLKKMQQGNGDIKLAAMVGKVEKVFKLMEFDSFIESYAAVDQAVQSFKA